MIKINKNLILIIVAIFLIGATILIASKIYPAKKSDQANYNGFIDNSKNEQSAGITINSDLQRKIDLVNISLALENYKKEKKEYPMTQGLEKTEDKNGAIYSLFPSHIKNIPVDTKDTFYYGYNSNGKTFVLTARLENDEDIDCQKVGEICLYKITSDDNNKEKLLKVARENLNFINSVRVVFSDKMINQIGDNDPIEFFNEEKIINESLIDFANKRKYHFSYQANEGIDKKMSEAIIVDGKNYIKNYMISQLSGVNDWIEVKEGDRLPQAPDSHSENFFSSEDQFSKFDFIRSVSEVEDVKIENIGDRECYHLILKPVQKEKNDYLLEILKSKFDLNDEEVKKLFLSSSAKSIFPNERVFKFYLDNNEELIIPFSKFITSPLYSVLVSGASKHSYKVNTLSIKGDLWVDKSSFIPVKENNKFTTVSYYYDENDKSFSFEMIFETEVDKQYFDINKNFDINIPEIAGVENSEKSKEIGQICDKIQNSFTKSQCINMINNKDDFMERGEENCEKIPHSTWEKNEARDDCFIGLLKRTKDISLCDKVEDDLERMVICYKEVAKISGDTSSCKKLDNDYLDDWCKNKSSTILMCRVWNESLEDSFWRRTIGNNEKYCLALARRSEEECSGLEEGYQRARCYSDIAEIKKELSLCDKIKSDLNLPDLEADSCYRKVAVAMGDLSICKKSGNEDDCIIEVVGNSNDFNLCEKISDDQKKDSCYLRVVYNSIQK